MDTVGIRVLSRNFGNSSLFTAKTSPSAGSVVAANRLWKHVDIFRKTVTSFQEIQHLFVTLLGQIIHVLCRISGFGPSPLFIFIFVLPYCFCFVVCFVFATLYCFVFYLCPCASFIIGICAVKSAC